MALTCSSILLSCRTRFAVGRVTCTERKKKSKEKDERSEREEKKRDTLRDRTMAISFCVLGCALLAIKIVEMRRRRTLRRMR